MSSYFIDIVNILLIKIRKLTKIDVAVINNDNRNIYFIDNNRTENGSHNYIILNL